MELNLWSKHAENVQSVMECPQNVIHKKNLTLTIQD